MKESKFDDIPGFEEQNTPMQLDTFEGRSFYGMKDRYIYDFSKQYFRVTNPTVYTDVYYDDDFNAQNPVQSPYEVHYIYDNLTRYDDSFSDGYIGIPGDAEIVIKDFKNIIESGSGNVVNSIELPLDYDENDIPIIDKNAVMYLGSKIQQVGYWNGSSPDILTAFRSGYVEFTVKTQNQNCIIGYGSPKFHSPSLLADAEAASKSGQLFNDGPTFINNEIAVYEENLSDLNHLYVEVVNGKLAITYRDEYGQDKESFQIISNQTIADNKWHHVVINFGKPGTLRGKNKKSNKRYIEFFIDGKLDIVDFNVINNKQIFFPKIGWLFGDPGLTFMPLSSGMNTADFGVDASFIGNNEIDMLKRSIFNPIGDAKLFSGQLKNFVSGFNYALSHDEIKLRNALFFAENNKYYPQKAIAVFAEMVTPTVSANKKRALKLFWNGVDNKNGIELDANFIIDTVSVTHKSLNSSTEIYNFDLSNDKQINVVENVVAAFTDHVNIFGPGKVLTSSLPEKSGTGPAPGLDFQTNYRTYAPQDSISFPGWNIISKDHTQNYVKRFSDGAMVDLPFSKISLKNGDRILLTNQVRPKENGIYVFNGYGNPLTRAEDQMSPNSINNSVVYVEDGIYAKTYWMLTNQVSSISDIQKWKMLPSKPDLNKPLSYPIFYDTYTDSVGNSRLIDVNSDLDISKYDVITFMNYPNSIDEVASYFVNDEIIDVKQKYENFINSLKIAASNGANIFVSSPKLAEDLGIVKKYSKISQLNQESDPLSAATSPFEIGESSERFFDTHRNNRYHIATAVPGLTDKETWIMSAFIGYIPENEYDNYEWHAKYTYRQFGLQEGDEFLIPGLALTPLSENDKLPGFRLNYRGNEYVYAIDPEDIITGTVVTKFANTYYDGVSESQNPYDDYATTIVVHNGQLLGDYPINGKIFVNCTEDSYTFSRKDYNVGVIQNVPANDPNETINRLLWQYSTRRLSRKPQKINIKELTEYGQTIPTNGGGGPIVQATTNSSNGIVRSLTDSVNKDYESDLYPSVDEEIYPIQEIPVLSMTWLGLNWLAE